MKLVGTWSNVAHVILESHSYNGVISWLARQGLRSHYADMPLQPLNSVRQGVGDLRILEQLALAVVFKGVLCEDF